MRVWVIWPGTPPDALRTLIEEAGGKMVQADDLLDRADAHLSTVETDVVLINSLTPGSQDIADWIMRCRFDRDDLRWVVALPAATGHPQVATWLPKLLRANIYDWVFESPTFADDLRDRLLHPWKWADAVRAMGGPDGMANANGPEERVRPPEPAPGPEPSGSMSLSERFSGISRRLLWQHRADRARSEPVASVRVLQPRRLLFLGAVGGAGTSGLVVALAKVWTRQGMSVAVGDAAATGGLLPLAWGSQPVEIGWDQARLPGDAWHQAAPGCFLLAQSGTRRGQVRPEDAVERFKAGVAAIPGSRWPALLVDGGTDLTWAGALRGFVEGVVLVTTPDRRGLYAGTWAVDVLSAVDTPLAGFILHRRRQPGQPTGRDVAEEWGIPCLADWSEAPELWDYVWTGQFPPDLAQRIEPLARRLAQASNGTRGVSELATPYDKEM